MFLFFFFLHLSLQFDRTAASIQKESIKRCEQGSFHFRSRCDLLHTARQLAVNKDFHNLAWPFPIRGTTVPWRILQRAQEQLFRALLWYHQSADLECACVVVMRLQLVLHLLWTKGCVCKPWWKEKVQKQAIGSFVPLAKPSILVPQRPFLHMPPGRKQHQRLLILSSLVS